ncbi:MAG: lectin MVL [Hyphomicrobiales bacterium]|nr:lectin MVL [Hyphomicrobiales bacterium]
MSTEAAEIDAGPIWNNMDAQGKCPGVCSGAGGTWDGNWRTTVPGQQSVCSCNLKHKPDKNAHNYNAGPIWNNADAQTKCPPVCISHNQTWTGNWHTKVQGKMSVCQCK